MSTVLRYAVWCSLAARDIEPAALIVDHGAEGVRVIAHHLEGFREWFNKPLTRLIPEDAEGAEEVLRPGDDGYFEAVLAIFDRSGLITYIGPNGNDK